MIQEADWFAIPSLYDSFIRYFMPTYPSAIQHEWLVKFVEHRIGDKRVVRQIQKWLKAGVMEQGQWTETKEGSPQGAVISPIRCQSLPALCLGCLGGGMAEDGGARGYYHRAIRR
jgi:hypothetical protein